MLTRITGAIAGGIAFAAGVRMMVVQFTNPIGVQGFAISMGIVLLSAGVAAVIASLRRHR